MRKRSTEILEKLILSNSKSMEVKKLITTYRISLKTLRTDVNEINDLIKKTKIDSENANRTARGFNFPLPLFAPEGRIRVNNTQPTKQHICKPDEKIGFQKSCFFPNAPVRFCYF